MSNGQVQTFGKKKTATAVATCVSGKGLIRVNGSPIQLVQPEILRYKVYEPVLVVGESKFAPVDIRVRVSGGGVTSQIYAIRQAISKALVAFYAKNFDAASALDLKKTLVSYDRTLLIADPRRCEPKKFGGVGLLLFMIDFSHKIFTARCPCSYPKIIPLNSQRLSSIGYFLIVHVQIHNQ